MATLGQQLVEKYKKFVSDSPEVASNIESTLRVLSYIYPGGNPAVSELLYSAGNLLSLLNDALLRQTRNIVIKVPLSNRTICIWLSVLETVEVFLEIAAQNWATDPVRWLVVVCVQLTKAALRLVMLYKNKSGIQVSPYIPQLNRKKELNPTPETVIAEALQTAVAEPIVKQTFTLSRSGRQIRSLQSTPPLASREWRVPSSKPSTSPGNTGELTDIQKLGESLHILRPLIHLCSMYVHGGFKSWKPWIVAGSVDTVSLWCLEKGAGAAAGAAAGANRCPHEMAELSRRRLMLLMYLLRSPFYDHYTKERLFRGLLRFREIVPFSRLLLNPLMEYLPYWQKIYHYNWMS